MAEVSTITKKGQVTIPISIRREWGLVPRQRLVFIKSIDKKVEIKPAVDFFNLRGSIKTKAKYSDRKAELAIDQCLTKTYGKKTKNN